MLQKTTMERLKSALIVYKKLLKDLLSMGFQPNPDNPCVVNKEIDGLQMTFTWHEDDLKVLHKNPRKINEVAEKQSRYMGI